MGMLFYVRREKCGSNQEGRGREGIIVNLKYCIDAMIYSFEKKSYGAGHELFDPSRRSESEMWTTMRLDSQDCIVPV